MRYSAEGQFAALGFNLPEVDDVGIVEEIIVSYYSRVAHIEPALSSDDLSQVGAAALKYTANIFIIQHTIHSKQKLLQANIVV